MWAHPFPRRCVSFGSCCAFLGMGKNGIGEDIVPVYAIIVNLFADFGDDEADEEEAERDADDGSSAWEVEVVGGEEAGDD